MSLIQVSNHESYVREDECGVLSNSQLLVEFEFLMRSDDFVRVLTRSSQLASIASPSAELTRLFEATSLTFTG